MIPGWVVLAVLPILRLASWVSRAVVQSEARAYAEAVWQSSFARSGRSWSAAKAGRGAQAGVKPGLEEKRSSPDLNLQTAWDPGPRGVVASLALLRPCAGCVRATDQAQWE